MISVTETSTGEPLFHLRAGDASYVFSVFHGYLLHLYCGPAMGEDDLAYLLVRVGHDSVVPRPFDTSENWFSLDIAPQEIPAYGTGDYRPSALMIRHGAGGKLTPGSTAVSVRYLSHEILPGKPPIPGDIQPAVRADEDEADTLIVTAEDPASGVKFRLYYTAMRSLPVILRRTAVENASSAPVDLLRIASASLDFVSPEEPAELLHLWGTWDGRGIRSGLPSATGRSPFRAAGARPPITTIPSRPSYPPVRTRDPGPPWGSA